MLKSLLILLILPGLILSFPGKSSSIGFADHAVVSQEGHSFHGHVHDDVESLDLTHDASSHSHETANPIQIPFVGYLGKPSTQVSSAPSKAPLWTAGQIERPPKTFS